MLEALESTLNTTKKKRERREWEGRGGEGKGGEVRGGKGTKERERQRDLLPAVK